MSPEYTELLERLAAEPDNCACGRPLRHRGRCSARRGRNRTESPQEGPENLDILSQGSAPNLSGEPQYAKCGRCVVRVLDARRVLAVQPDCGQHGFFGKVDLKRAQKADDLAAQGW